MQNREYSISNSKGFARTDLVLGKDTLDRVVDVADLVLLESLVLAEFQARALGHFVFHIDFSQKTGSAAMTLERKRKAGFDDRARGCTNARLISL